MTGNPGAASSDTISFSSGDTFIQAAQMVPMGDYFMAGSGEDTISLGLNDCINNWYYWQAVVPC